MTNDELSGIIKAFRAVSKDYEYHVAQLKWYEDQAMDFQHFFELEDLNYNERAKLATRYAKSRKERRKHKDLSELLCPLAELFETEAGAKLIRHLEAVLGEMRKVEDRHKRRSYRCCTERNGAFLTNADGKPRDDAENETATQCAQGTANAEVAACMQLKWGDGKIKKKRK